MPAPALPILYLPGASGRSKVWQPIALRLSMRRPPVLVDYPGLGAAPSEPGLDSLTRLTEYLIARMPERCDVISLSMGSAVALRIALAAPERVRALVLVTPLGGVDARALGAVDWRDAFRKQRPFAPTWFLDDEEDLSPRLAQITAPTLLVLGEQDDIAPVSVGRYFASHLPSARLEIIERGTHDLEEEQPDLVASLIEAYLRGL